MCDPLSIVGGSCFSPSFKVLNVSRNFSMFTVVSQSASYVDIFSPRFSDLNKLINFMIVAQRAFRQSLNTSFNIRRDDHGLLLFWPFLIMLFSDKHIVRSIFSNYQGSGIEIPDFMSFFILNLASLRRSDGSSFEYNFDHSSRVAIGQLLSELSDQDIFKIFGGDSFDKGKVRLALEDYSAIFESDDSDAISHFVMNKLSIFGNSGFFRNCVTKSVKDILDVIFLKDQDSRALGARKVTLKEGSSTFFINKSSIKDSSIQNLNAMFVCGFLFTERKSFTNLLDKTSTSLNLYPGLTDAIVKTSLVLDESICHHLLHILTHKEKKRSVSPRAIETRQSQVSSGSRSYHSYAPRCLERSSIDSIVIKVGRRTYEFDGVDSLIKFREFLMDFHV